VRITVTLDPDVQVPIQRAMHQRGLTLDEAVNDAIRAGAAPFVEGSPVGAHFPTYDMGEPAVDLTQGPALGSGARRLASRSATRRRV
jgi:hypothetical protein